MSQFYFLEDNELFAADNRFLCFVCEELLWLVGWCDGAAACVSCSCRLSLTESMVFYEILSSDKLELKASTAAIADQNPGLLLCFLNVNCYQISVSHRIYFFLDFWVSKCTVKHISHI